MNDDDTQNLLQIPLFFIFSFFQFSSYENKMEVGPTTIVHVPRNHLNGNARAINVCTTVYLFTGVQINRADSNFRKLKF